MASIIIVGGVSVNDPEGHDTFPYNFMNPAIAKAKQLHAAGKTGVVIAIYAPSYEERVKRQKKEHSTVHVGTLRCADSWSATLCNWGIVSAPKDTKHFLGVARTSAVNAGATYQELRSAKDLSDLLKRTSQIESIYYFGHSNRTLMFLEYSVSVPSSGTVVWGETEAKSIPKTNFAPNAKFVSYGCNQGDSGGLAQKLSDASTWGIRSIGSNGKTSFEPIGQGKPYPSSAGGWAAYANGSPETSPIDIVSIK